MNIQWYPGHMTKTKRQLAPKLKLIHLVIIVLDARAPKSSYNEDFDKLFEGKEKIFVLNKCDLLTENIPEDDSTVKISAKKAQGIDRLLKVVAANLPETAKRMKLLLPYDKAGFTAKLRENGKVFTEEYTETGVLVDALVDQMLIKQMSQYETE